MAKITVIVPQSGEELRKYLSNLPELNLVADLKVISIPWQEDITGTDADWKEVAITLLKEWKETDGFVIWAPEQSILNLSGYLSLALPNPGKPIILFSAPSSKQLDSESFLELGLKSVLINASYLAQSDLAEVLILSGSLIYKPDRCYWKQEDGFKIIASLEDPAAIIDTSLNKCTFIHGRHNKQHYLFIPDSLEKEIIFSQWLPGMKVNPISSISKETKALVIRTESQYWDHPQFQELRKELLSSGLPLIWYSQGQWGDDQLEGNEVAIAHPQYWWIALATQFEFGLDNRDAALEKLKRLTQKSV